MSRPSPSIVFGALAGCVALASLGGLIALNTGVSIGVGKVSVGLTDGYEEASHRLLSGDGPIDLDRSEAKARQAITLSPYDVNAYLRLAYIDRQRNGRLTPAGADQLAKSYALMPTDPNTAEWRIRFALENWSGLRPETRTAVYEEVRAFHTITMGGVNIQSILKGVSDADGRIAAALWLQGFEPATR